MNTNPYRNLPAVNELLLHPAVQTLQPGYAHELILSAVRQELDAARAELRTGSEERESFTVESFAERIVQRVQRTVQPKLRAVLNATGIVLHTNLGRAPMCSAAGQAALLASQGYLNLELDLETGKRSSRQAPIREWLCQLTGAESATAVNNNAAATVIVLRALAAGKEVIVSRGQLIEIGGSFRIPDIMSVSGAILREVGTTNITRLSDFQNAIGPNTGALLQVHTSNYRISGFTQSVPLADLVSLGRKHGLPVIDDIGSGALLDFAEFGFRDEPTAPQSLATGADLILFSGDKLLGGPQAGLIAGRKEYIAKIEKDPLMRAFRLDKMTLAALEASLRVYLNPEQAKRDIPVLRLLSMPVTLLRQRTEAFAAQLRADPVLQGKLSVVTVRDDVAYVGGGSLPDQTLPTVVLALASAALPTQQLAYRLRVGTPAVLGRVHEELLLLDLRTIFPEQEASLLSALTKVLA